MEGGIRCTGELYGSCSAGLSALGLVIGRTMQVLIGCFGIHWLELEVLAN